MNAGELENFNDLFEKVARLKSVKCRLRHERVLYDGENGLPIAECLPELGFQRIGLCSPEIRRERISCGHTMARYALENALSLLAANGVETECLNSELQNLTNQIHSLDHRKGFAEKDLAELINKKIVKPEIDLSAEIEKANLEIKSIEDSHDECADKIDVVRGQIFTEMQLFAETL